jgi:hypothetical protein
LDNATIENAAERMKNDDQKLPADSEMEKAIERAKAIDGAKGTLSPAELHADDSCFGRPSSWRAIVPVGGSSSAANRVMAETGG